MLLLERDGSLRRTDGPGWYRRTNRSAVARLVRRVSGSILWWHAAARRRSIVDQPAVKMLRRLGKPILSMVDSR